MLYCNPYAKTVEWKSVDVIDCYLIDNKLTNGAELYFSITPVEKGGTPHKYLMKKMDIA